jgi:hypothetical protein
MATYKVIQDIEAEDKFLGPLTLKQFIFAAITLVCGYLCFFFLTKGLWFLIFPLLPIMLVGGFLGFPWGRDQPTETWLLAKIRYFVKPHLRIWDQTGVQELVTITAPKKQDPMFVSDNLSKTEVKSRLRALADTIDSRGWAVKNNALNLVAAPTYAPNIASSDRLLDISLPSTAPIVEMGAADDIMDARYNPLAQNFDRMIQQSEQTHRQATIKKMEAIRDGKLPAPATPAGDDFWFMNQPQEPLPAGYTTFDTKSATVSSDTSAGLSKQEKALLDKIHKEESRILPNISKQKNDKFMLSGPVAAKKDKASVQESPEPDVPLPDPTIYQLADNDDLSVETIQRQFNKNKQPPSDEVIINLH